MKNFVRPGTGARMGWHAAFLLGALCQAAVLHAQTPPFDVATALSTEVEPVERTFDIPATGQYRLTLTDIGALLTGAERAPLASGNVLITRGTTVVASVSTSAEPGDVDNALFDATAGTYKIHIVGKPGTSPRSGPVSVRVAQVGTTVQALEMGATLSPPQRLQTGLATYQTEVDVPAGDYDLSVTDLLFPRAVESAVAFLVRADDSTRVACANTPAVADCPSTRRVALEAGRYVLVVVGAIPTSSDGGVFNVKLEGVGGPVAHSRSVELGQVRRLSASEFQLDSGNHSLRLNDLEFPAALQQRSAIVHREGQVVALANAANPEVSFNVASNDTAVDVFAYARPATTESAGSYYVDVRPNGGSSAALSSVQAVGVSPVTAYTFSGDITTAGNYRARLGDFAFPVALATARLAVVQNGSVIGSTAATTVGPTWTLDVANLAAGSVTLVAIVRSGSPGGTASQSAGTFGVELAPADGGALAVDATQGVGALISVRKVNIATAGRYDMAVSDLNFPAPFSDLMAVVSRGATRVGTLLVGSGGGSPTGGTARLLDIDAAVGDYTITLIAQPGTAQGAAAYGISFVPAPPPPTVTLTASPSAVASGGTTTLTWTSQGATTCTASSNPSGTWIGSKVLSGSEAITPITGAISFTLRCIGSTGRATEQSVSVSIQTASSNDGGGGGGGGALGGWFVAMLLVAGAGCSAQRMRRRPAVA